MIITQISHVTVGISRCDWYAGSVSMTIEKLISALCDSLGTTFRQLERAHNGYKCEGELVADNVSYARIMWGGVNPRPFVMATGANSGSVMSALRSLPCAHTCSRLDAAVDLIGETQFDQITSEVVHMLESAKLRHVPQISQVGDWIHGKARTLYVGSRTSRTFLRIYEKTAEQRAKGNDDVPNDWVRVELEYKPNTAEGKAEASHMSPDDCWRASDWTRAVYKLLTGCSGLQPLNAPLVTPSSRSKALDTLFRQYGPTLSDVRAEKGDAAFCSWLLHKLSLRDLQRLEKEK